MCASRCRLIGSAPLLLRGGPGLREVSTWLGGDPARSPEQPRQGHHAHEPQHHRERRRSLGALPVRLWKDLSRHHEKHRARRERQTPAAIASITRWEPLRQVVRAKIGSAPSPVLRVLVVTSARRRRARLGFTRIAPRSNLERFASPVLRRIEVEICL